MALDSFKKKVKIYEELIDLGKLISSSMDYKNIKKKSENKIRKILDCQKIHLYTVK